MSTDEFDPYSRISGFYGPGAFACWYLMITAVLVTWLFNDPRHRFRASNEFIAAAAFPLIATGHFIYLVASFPAEHKGYLIRNLGDLMVGGIAAPVVPTVPRSPLTESSTSDDSDQGVGGKHTDLYPHVMAIYVALKVSDIYADLCWLAWGYATYHGERKAGGRQRPAVAVLVASLVLLVLAQMMLCLSSQGWLLLLMGVIVRYWPLVMAAGSLFLLVVLTVTVYVLAGIAGTTQAVTGSLVTDAQADARRRPAILVVWCVVFFGAWIWSLHWIRVSLLWDFLLIPPRTGLSMSELDQVAALLGGLVSLGFSIVSALKWRVAVAADSFEMA